MKILCIIRRQFKNIDKETFLILYISIVRPRMEYAIQAWSPHFIRDIDCLETVQRRATTLIKGFKKYSYEDRVLMLGLTTLEKRRLRGDLIETYKILFGKERERETTVKTSSFSAKLVTTYAVTAIRWLQIDAVWNYGGISSVNVWLNHGTNFPVTLSQHRQPTHSRIVSTCCTVGHYKAEASTSDNYKYKYKYKYKYSIIVSDNGSIRAPLLVSVIIS